MQTIAAYVVDTIHSILTPPPLAVVMSAAREMDAFNGENLARLRKLMLRYIPVVMLISFSTMLLMSQQTSAFTLGFGPLPNNSSAMPESEPSDVPTPQLIRIAIDPSGAKVGAISPTDGYRPSEPALRVQKQQRVPVSETLVPQHQTAQQARSTDAVPQLSGAELLLLRKTSVVADHRGD